MKILIRVCLFGLLYMPVHLWADADVEALMANVLIDSPQFQITEFDLYMYLKPVLDADTGDLNWGSRERLREGLQQLYALKVLALESQRAETLSEAEQMWVADHELSMVMVRNYLSEQVEKEAGKIDFTQLAKEYYLANKEEFFIPERRTLRALLIRTDCRSAEEAERIAIDLVRTVSDAITFESVIREHTEDPVAAESGGLMIDVVPGQTVKEFETAAFALEDSGDFSEPVLSEFGVHVIQLVSMSPRVNQPYKAVEQGIITRLQQEEKNKILQTLRMEAREYRPEGLQLQMDKLEALISSTTSAMP